MTSDGNGARDVVDTYFAEHLDLPPEAKTMFRVDHFLMWLWAKGFKVTPVERTDIRSSA